MVAIGSGSKNNHASHLCILPQSVYYLHIMLYIYHSRKGHLEIVTNLVTSTNADVNSKDNIGETALHKAYK